MITAIISFSFYHSCTPHCLQNYWTLPVSFISTYNTFIGWTDIIHHSIFHIYQTEQNASPLYSTWLLHSIYIQKINAINYPFHLIMHNIFIESLLKMVVTLTFPQMFPWERERERARETEKEQDRLCACVILFICHYYYC